MPTDPFERVRAIAMTYPEATEKPFAGHTTPCWRVRDKIFVFGSDWQETRSLQLKAPAGAQAVLVGSNPERFYVPRYIGHKGWIGLWLNPSNIDWDELAGLIDQSYRLIAPKTLVAKIAAP